MRETVLITGASRGIGYATAELFAVNGYTVYANYRSSPKSLELLSEKLSERGCTLIPLYADVSNSNDVEHMVSQTNGVDILINNAGIAQFKQFVDMSETDWDNMMSVNLKSVYLCTHCVIPHMIKRKHGAIVNISSVWGVTGGSCEVHYSAAKAGVIGFTKALAKEMAPSGIRVNCIAPGVIETDMNKELSDYDRQLIKEQTPLGTIGLPDHIAQAALFLAENQFITGEILNVNGGFHI
ncbi:MAG: 3-oxoacyl-ACP reductase FabG [Bacillota bacterium]|jgi:3-oxoacyl-[acyl-carrier protein] reductase|nr:3-oxoacyl-ACP reductase FabG [Bacillota bacterium]HOB42494.1 3-oxoacyl-ACP reductase FabG [Bacillota bacterium]HOK70268.1 3-oxoacyl-ACP reductase FabG [Bacillota bacterium]HOO30771.1 3-oxoacyl-ACP reductase FabG [Bacillota bacterium]HPQ02084.1 3-oxoacyl-ACP reductase FabG [Bacillota bacterium]